MDKKWVSGQRRIMLGLKCINNIYLRGVGYYVNGIKDGKWVEVDLRPLLNCVVYDMKLIMLVN
jgi:hypothetical protein